MVDFVRRRDGDQRPSLTAVADAERVGIWRFIQEQGLSIKRHTLRSQLSIYTQQGLLRREGAAYRLTNDGATAVNGGFALLDDRIGARPVAALTHDDSQIDSPTEKDTAAPQSETAVQC